MKTKRIKAKPIADLVEFAAVVNEAASLQASALEIVAEREAKITALRVSYEAKLAPYKTDIAAHFNRAEKFADANRKLVLPPGRKSVELSAAVYGWRTGTKAVKLAKTVTEELVIRALKAFGFEAYVRTHEEIAKDKIISDAELFPVDGKEVHCLPKAPVQHSDTVSSVAMVALSDIGLSITQTEGFYIEPKADNGETIKAAAA